MYGLILVACLGCNTTEIPVVAIVATPVVRLVETKPARRVVGAVLKAKPARRVVGAVVNLKPARRLIAAKPVRSMFANYRPVRRLLGIRKR